LKETQNIIKKDNLSSEFDKEVWNILYDIKTED
jgi:hypothetical protein